MLGGHSRSRLSRFHSRFVPALSLVWLWRVFTVSCRLYIISCFQLSESTFPPIPPTWFRVPVSPVSPGCVIQFSSER